MEKLHSFLNMLHTITGIPMLYIDCRSHSISYCIGLREIPKITHFNVRKISDLTMSHNPLLLSDGKNSEKAMYVLGISGGKTMIGLVILLKEIGFPGVIGSHYLSAVNLINLFLFDVPVTLDSAVYEAKILDGELWLGISEGESTGGLPREEGYITHYIEKRILQSVRSGNLYTLRTEILEYISLAHKSLYSPDRNPRNRKNTLITMTTMAFIEAVGGGLPSKEGMSLVIKYHGIIERLYNFNQVDTLIEEILVSFCKSVQAIKLKELSYPVYYCVDYVKSHIRDKIKLDSIAKKLQISPGYLSALFKEQYGVNFSSYVIAEKIEEAKKLVNFSDETFSEIAFQLSFSDQSHFSRSFKKYTGYTPLQYRNRQV